MCMIFQLSIKQPIKPINWHGTCGCKCRLDASVCNEKQHWNSDKFRCKYKELIDKGRCDDGCKCKCEKSCDVGEYLDYANCKCTEKLIEKLVDE